MTHEDWSLVCLSSSKCNQNQNAANTSIHVIHIDKMSVSRWPCSARLSVLRSCQKEITKKGVPISTMSHLSIFLCYFAFVLTVHGMKSMDHNNDIKPGHQIVKEYHFHPYWHQDNAQEVLSNSNSNDMLKKNFSKGRSCYCPPRRYYP